MTIHPDDPSSETARFIAEIRQEFPRFRVIKKRGDSLSHVIDVLLRILTLGGQNQYITNYHTVIGPRLYVPDGWDEIDDVTRVITLRHERVHLRQTKRYTPLGIAVIYALPIFPLGLAYGRARIEWEAYTETIHATAELRGLDEAKSAWLRAHILKQFTSAAYGWMWPFPKQLERWYDEALASIPSRLPYGERVSHDARSELDALVRRSRALTYDRGSGRNVDPSWPAFVSSRKVSPSVTLSFRCTPQACTTGGSNEGIGSPRSGPFDSSVSS